LRKNPPLQGKGEGGDGLLKGGKLPKGTSGFEKKKKKKVTGNGAFPPKKGKKLAGGKKRETGEGLIKSADSGVP